MSAGGADRHRADRPAAGARGHGRHSDEARAEAAPPARGEDA